LRRYAFGLPDAAASIQTPVPAVLARGYRTLDIMTEGAGVVGTKEMGRLIRKAIRGKNDRP
jgi:3-isopropylmalate dehydrogenase